MARRIRIATYEAGKAAAAGTTGSRRPDHLLRRGTLLYFDLATRGQIHWCASAFTRTTGRAHWHVPRARAIETGCWIFAAAQCGDHAGERRTYGHSQIVDPWEISLSMRRKPGFIIADIDPAC